MVYGFTVRGSAGTQSARLCELPLPLPRLKLYAIHVIFYENVAHVLGIVKTNAYNATRARGDLPPEARM